MMQHVTPSEAHRVPSPADIRWRSPRWKLILRSVAKKHGIGVDKITGRGRRQEIVAARFESAYRMRTKLGMTYTQIGRRLNRDHTSALHAVREHARVISSTKNDPRRSFRLKEILVRTKFSRGMKRPAQGSMFMSEYIAARDAFILAARRELDWSAEKVGQYVGMHKSSIFYICRYGTNVRPRKGEDAARAALSKAKGQEK